MNGLLRYAALRLGLGLLVLAGVLFLAYLLVYQLPGDPARVLAGARADEETVARIRRIHRLDDPFPQQYGRFVQRLLKGDLGTSLARDEPVLKLILDRLPATAALAISGWLIWVLAGFGAGVLAAWRRRPAEQRALLAISMVSLSTPTFWVGLLLLYFFANRLRWLPAGGYGGPEHLVLPALAVGFSGFGYYARLAMTVAEQVVEGDYVRAARARGLGEVRLLLRYVLRGCSLPLATLAGADLATLLGGVVFAETVFGWPGLGRLAVESVAYLDLPVILGIVTFSATAVVVLNLVLDLLYPFLDPRIVSSQ